jgi:hypothetical protein
MMDLDNIEIEIRCPKCNFYNYIKIKQARLRDVIICRGCKSNIQLDDQMNEVRKSVRSFRSAIEDLENSLHDVNIEIKF